MRGIPIPALIRESPRSLLRGTTSAGTYHSRAPRSVGTVGFVSRGPRSMRTTRQPYAGATGWPLPVVRRPADCAQGPFSMIAAAWRARLGHAEASRVSGKDPPARMVRRPAHLPLQGREEESWWRSVLSTRPAQLMCLQYCLSVRRCRGGGGGFATLWTTTSTCGAPTCWVGWVGSVPRPVARFSSPPLGLGSVGRVVHGTEVRVPPVAGHQSPDLFRLRPRTVAKSKTDGHMEANVLAPPVQSRRGD